LGKKILLVDDDPLVLGSLAAALKASGYEVWATDATERALELVEEVGPDVVVTDYRMPGMDGVSLLERLRERSPAILKVVYSATAPPQAHAPEWMAEVYWVAKSAGHRALLGRLQDLLEGEVEAR
jgi:CheY-like chemotaxis protein